MMKVKGRFIRIYMWLFFTGLRILGFSCVNIKSEIRKEGIAVSWNLGEACQEKECEKKKFDFNS